MRFSELTVLMPLYNFERFVGPCLDAYLAQTVQPKEYILVDDGSSDSTLSILNAYAQAHPTLFRVLSLPHVGLNPAVDRGMLEVTTEFVYPAAADDFPRPELLECFMRGHEMYPHAGLVTVNYQFWLDDGHCLPDRPPLPDQVDSGIRLSEKTEFLDPEQLIQRIRRASTHPIGLAMYRSKDWTDSPALNRDLRHYQDFLINYSHALRHGIVHFPRPLLDFRLALNTYGNQGRYNSRTEIATCRRFLKVLSEPEFDDVRDKIFRTQVLGLIGWRLFAAAVTLPGFWKYLPRLLTQKLLVRGTSMDLRYFLSPFYRRLKKLQ